MNPFRTVRATAAYLPEANIDTDVIYPARFLLIPDRTGLGQYAFADRRQVPNGTWDFTPAEILVTGENFGCGSSREQAVWCLASLGIKAIIAPSFGEIFHNNCLKNGVLPIRQDGSAYADIAQKAAKGAEFLISLEEGTITVGGAVHEFAIDAARREAILAGLDEIGVLLNQSGAEIDAFEKQRRASAPWTFFPEEGAAQ